MISLSMKLRTQRINILHFFFCNYLISLIALRINDAPSSAANELGDCKYVRIFFKKNHSLHHRPASASSMHILLCPLIRDNSENYYETVEQEFLHSRIMNLSPDLFYLSLANDNKPPVTWFINIVFIVTELEAS
jgi:hypothetical protein